MNAKSKTTENWEERQAALRLVNGKWDVSFLATTPGGITTIGGEVAEFETPEFEIASAVINEWITSGIVPAGYETHAPYWFTAA